MEILKSIGFLFSVRKESAFSLTNQPYLFFFTFVLFFIINSMK
jgi:hypothetical protein